MSGDIVCFGEVLWDLLPHGRFLGGAPLNVAYHLARLGRRPRLVSALGRDTLGDEALAAMAAGGIGTAGVRRDDVLATGTVAVQLDAAGQASYEIRRPVAWDRIVVRPGPAEPVAALVFGTLALRSPENRESLRAWRQVSRVAVCDVNLRAPFDDPALVDEFARGADLLKLNDDEARRLSPAGAGSTPAEQAAALAERHGCGVVCITCGAHGAWLWHGGEVCFAPTPPVTVRDTIGAGDAFTAALLDGFLAAGGRPDWPAALARACRLGAWVASQSGAQPPYPAGGVPGVVG